MAISVQSQPKKEAIQAAARKARGMWLPTRFAGHIILSWTLNARHESLVSSIFSAGFWSCFGTFSPF
jgi:hypothetical protein